MNGAAGTTIREGLASGGIGFATVVAFFLVVDPLAGRPFGYTPALLAIIASISLVGIVLVNALLVIPAATAKLLARSLTQLFVLAPILGTAGILAGLALSYSVDLPPGPAIVVVSGLGFLAAWLWRASKSRGRRPRK